MIFREIERKDIPEIFKIRIATDENCFTQDELNKRGITFNSVRLRLQTTNKGWLCEIDKKAVGFVIADKQTGEIWVIAVLPEYINKGIGGTLLKLSEEWLISNGVKKFWLVTDPNKKLRAYSFYLKNGWTETKTENGILYMEKKVK